MPRPWILITVFLLSFLLFSIWLVPAQMVVPRLDGMAVAGGSLSVSEASGRLWEGGARVRWQRYDARVTWDLDWHDLTPGARLTLEAGDLRAAGWLGGTSGTLSVSDLDLSVPLERISAHIPRGDAGGRVSGRIERLVWDQGEMTELAGKLDWTGGPVSWNPNGSATVPPMSGRLFHEDGAARAVVEGPDSSRMADARLENGQLHLRVYRAWPMALGVSGGGQASDVVLEVSRPFGGQGAS
jgi:general secretion pathway protein N